jgi:hypothetical protein
VNYALQVSEHTHGNNPMNLSRFNHALAQSIHCKTYIRCIQKDALGNQSKDSTEGSTKSEYKSANNFRFGTIGVNKGLQLSI